MAKRKRRFGSSPDVHEREAKEAGSLAINAARKAAKAIRQGSCHTAMDHLSYALADKGKLRAHEISIRGDQGYSPRYNKTGTILTRVLVSFRKKCLKR